MIATAPFAGRDAVGLTGVGAATANAGAAGETAAGGGALRGGSRDVIMSLSNLGSVICSTLGSARLEGSGILGSVI